MYFNHNNFSSKDELQIIFLKKPRVTKIVVFIRIKIKLLKRLTCGKMVVIYHTHPNFEARCPSAGREEVTQAMGGSVQGGAGDLLHPFFFPYPTCT